MSLFNGDLNRILGIGGGIPTPSPVSPTSVGSKGIPLVATNTPVNPVTPSERHALLYSKPRMKDNPRPAYVPAKNYMRGIIPDIAKNPSTFGGDPRKLGVVSAMVKFEERKAINTGRAIRGEKVSSPAERIGGVQFLTGIKKRPNRPDGMLISKINRDDAGIRLDNRGINGIPPHARKLVASAPAQLPIAVPVEETSVSMAPSVLKPEEAPDVSKIYAAVEGGATATATEPKPDWSKTIITLGMIALVFFLVTKGRI